MNAGLERRELLYNKRTGNFVDEVAAKYRDYLQHENVPLTFEKWHDSPMCPKHPLCNFCKVVGR